jgi:hypothetical protein
MTFVIYVVPEHVLLLRMCLRVSWIWSRTRQLCRRRALTAPTVCDSLGVSNISFAIRGVFEELNSRGWEGRTEFSLLPISRCVL